MLVQMKKEVANMDIFELFREIAKTHDIQYLNCIKNPEKAAFGFMRSQVLAGNMELKDKNDNLNYVRFLLEFKDEDDASKFMKVFPEQIVKADLALYKCIYYQEKQNVNVIFNIVDMNGSKFGAVQENKLRAVLA